jgi:hypothetical protein
MKNKTMPLFLGDFGKQFGRSGIKKPIVSEYAYSKETTP